MKLLVLEDNPDHLELTLDMLRESYGMAADVHSCSLLGEALEYLKAHPVDVFLCDLQLPDSTITETVERIRTLEDAPPIIILSSLTDEELAQQLVKDGVQDYLPKSEMSPVQLLRACNYAVERKKLNRSFQNKNEDYRAFCYSLTHDFRSSLWQIARYADIFKAEARKHYPQDQSLPWEFLNRISDRVDNVQKLVDDLQDYLALDAVPVSFSDIKLTAVVSNAVDMLADTIAQRDAVVEVCSLPSINGSFTQMQLLFTNLISNGIKYNDKREPRVDITLEEETEEHILIAVSDNGIGIANDLLNRIFTPFERLHSKDDYPGSGLGLSIVRRIVQYHEGRISVSSKPGEGTRFFLRLPKRPS